MCEFFQSLFEWACECLGSLLASAENLVIQALQLLAYWAAEQLHACTLALPTN